MHQTLPSPKLQKIKSDQSQYWDDRLPQCPHSWVTPRSCTPAWDTARCLKPPPWLQAPAISIPSSQTPPALSFKFSPGFLCPSASAATGSEGHQAAHTTAERGAMAPSLYKGIGVPSGEASRDIYGAVGRGSTAAERGYRICSLS